MKARGFTHVSVHAQNLGESVLFYQSLFNMQEIPAPEFPFPVRWLRVGDLELHLFESDAAAPAGHHFGLDVDDFGLAVFAVLGVRAGLGAGVLPLVAVLMGAITGVVGGAVRDVLCGETPMILRREIYATAAIAGASTYAVLSAWVGPGAITLTAAIAVTLLLRIFAVWFDLHLPAGRPKE